jgi:hypothetical protein
MFKMIALLAAGAFAYNMGHHAATTPADASAKAPAMWETAATASGTWIARQVHEQTAWAAEGSKAQPAPIEVRADYTIASR